MIRTQSLTEENVSVMAVGALDELVAELVRASGLGMAPEFLDWIADVATPLVDARVTHAFQQPRFLSSLHMGDPRIALSRWVRHWVGPQIAGSFTELAPHLMEFKDSPQTLPVASARTDWQFRRESDRPLGAGPWAMAA